jgi:hypothetical protein
MKKSILITEKQLSNIISIINEQSEPNLLYKTLYNPDTKTILASYYLIQERPDSFFVANPKEFVNRSVEWGDGSQDYKIGIELVDLPKSQVEIEGNIDGFPNFKIFKIPYFLFKKEPKLSIRRFEGNKRASLDNQGSTLKKINDSKVVDAFEALGGDYKKIKNYVSRIENPILPKPVDPSVYGKEDNLFKSPIYQGN